MKKIMIFGLAILGSNCFAEISFWDDHERGWFWYEDPKEEEEEKFPEEQEIQEKKYAATAELKQYQAELEDAKAKAVLHPTPENVARYQMMQKDMTEKAEKFSEIWMKNVYKNIELDATHSVPMFPQANRIYLAEKRKQKIQKIKQLSQEYGLFFFFKKQCPYCEAFAPIVKLFSEKYNWEVLAISEFGERLPMFERSVQDNGLAETWGVNSYPSLFAVNPKTGHVIPIANGMISIQEMEERIMALAGEGNA